VIARGSLALLVLWVGGSGWAAALDLGLPTPNDALLRPGGEPVYYQPTVEGTVVSGMFGCVRRDGRKFHEGIDIRCGQRDGRGEPLDPVLAVADGRVAFVNDRPGRSNYGRYILLEHVWDGIGVHTLYAHLAAVVEGVTAGVVVRRGQRLGTLGHSTNTREGIPRERAHLHFEVNFLINPEFARWNARRNPQAPPFGNYNGRNFIGLDPAALLRAAATQPDLNFAAYLAAQPIGFTLLTRRPLPWARLQPLQVRPARAGDGPVVAWEVGATTWGMPLVIWPRTPAELSEGLQRALRRAPFVLARINEKALDAASCRRLVQRRAPGTGWQLTEAGREWAELLTYVP